LHLCMCMFAWCLLAWADHSLPALILRVLHYALIQKRLKTLTMNKSYLLDGDNNDGDHSWTYPFSG